MHHFFVPPELLVGPRARLAGEQAHQVRQVLRLRPGEQVLLLDGCGWAHPAELAGYRSGEPEFELLGRMPAGGEPAVHITLCQAVLKGERFEWLLQKGTEIGIGEFVPLICTRSVVAGARAIAGKAGRWRRIIREAAEQSGRGLLPTLAPPADFAQAVLAGEGSPAAGGATLRLIPWEEERTAGLRALLDGRNLAPGARIQLYIGPEGGLTAAEVDLARAHGIWPVSLGPRTLRAETAGLVAAAVVFYAAGAFEPPA